MFDIIKGRVKKNKKIIEFSIKGWVGGSGGGQIRGPKFEHQADEMREIKAMFGWFIPLYLVCVLSQYA